MSERPIYSQNFKVHSKKNKCPSQWTKSFRHFESFWIILTWPGSVTAAARNSLLWPFWPCVATGYSALPFSATEYLMVFRLSAYSRIDGEVSLVHWTSIKLGCTELESWVTKLRYIAKTFGYIFFRFSFLEGMCTCRCNAVIYSLHDLISLV